jgi:predicted nucleic acid-binding Zn ribbon protein
MVRVTECFECGAKENEVKLIFTSNGPTLCEKCSEKIKK